MPRKNSLKEDVEGGYYHIYNRGVEKRIIFQNDQDYKVFLSYLKYSLSPPPDPNSQELKVDFTLKGQPFKGVPRLPLNFETKINLLAFCLMPNHFHLLILQKEKGAMRSFINSVLTRYVMYFNRKYERVGGLFQGVYKAVNVQDEQYLLHLSRYIHLNPIELSSNLIDTYSSYASYLKIKKLPWVKSDLILSFFENSLIKELKKVNTYQNFVENYKDKENSFDIEGLTLEDQP